MSNRLQLLVSPELDLALTKAAKRQRISKGEYVRRALQRSLYSAQGPDPLDALASLDAPTADIDDMLSEIEAGRT